MTWVLIHHNFPDDPVLADKGPEVLGAFVRSLGQGIVRHDLIDGIDERPDPLGRWTTLYVRGMPAAKFGEHGRHRRKISRSVRRMVMERDEMTCGLCGHEVPTDDVHIDHVVPHSRGGSDQPHNLQVAHSACNIRKGNQA